MTKTNDTDAIKTTETEEGQESKLIKERELAAAMRVKFPDRVPIVLMHRPGVWDSTLRLEKEKYLIPRDYLWQHFQRLIRRKINLRSEQSMFFFVNNRLPSPSETIGQIDARDGDQHGYLSCIYGAENTFG